MKKMNIFHIAAEGLEDFRQVAAQAKELGATHMMVGDLPRSRWMWEQDLTDPYPNWSMGHAQLFKLVCPPQLSAYLPQEHIRQCFELVKARCEILREYGLRPALFSNEPFWLPEKAYRDHPKWRGARCDHPRRSRKPYYSPNIDNPEVLSMYRYAMRELVRETGIEFFRFMSNDSGGGISFSSGTYCGPNGPSSSRAVTMADRICGFMDALSEGAREGGVEAIIHFNSDIPFKAVEESIGAVWPRLKENQIVNGRDKDGRHPISSISDLGAPREPVKKLPRTVQFARFLLEAEKQSRPIVLFDVPRSDFEEAFLCMKLARERKLEDITDAYALLKECAVAVAGRAGASRLADAWEAMDEGFSHLSHTGLDLIMYGCQHQRWINRPFLLFPEELSPEEKRYYRAFQFQAMGETEADDLMNLQGIEGARGFTSAFLINETMQKAIGSMKKAVSLLESIQADGKTQPDPDKLNLLILRIRAEICFFENVRNAVRFQELKDRTDRETPPVLSLRWPTRNDSRIEEFQNITRDEIENTYELMEILDGHLEDILRCVSPEEEDIFVYSTEFIKQLKWKAETMLDHMDDGKRVYETHNI